MDNDDDVLSRLRVELDRLDTILETDVSSKRRVQDLLTAIRSVAVSLRLLLSEFGDNKDEVPPSIFFDFGPDIVIGHADSTEMDTSLPGDDDVPPPNLSGDDDFPPPRLATDDIEEDS